MWVNWYVNSTDVRGRVNLDHVDGLDTVQAGSAWFIQANIAGSTYKVSAETYPDRATALLGIADLLLNGS